MAVVALSTQRKVVLAAEFVLVFFGLTLVYDLLARGTSPIPVLLVLGAASVWYLLRTPAFDRRSLWRAEAVRGQLRPVLTLWAVTAVVAVVVVAVVLPDQLFALPRQQPLLWLAVMVFYPLFSVYPQELVFRAFLFERYGPAFGSWTVAASAVAFGFVHIIFGSWVSVVLSAAGGWIFATRYRRTQSLLVASIEHALYGMLVFSVGLGQFFFHGAVQT
ncbi:CAAX protease [Lentzea guizhouensis]|uniref:CAAX protease n=1 Tax=Lentzea guizhouensis TaxID=1586287 RepID=A0A1B2HAZ6_9PSEU|nr:CPBP family intramembrane glutamic endopeptidase [Lentzea guizhouensis]ANZ34888.1 CAAX protease [Lentzea guizhouensis]